jgi:hypothetical protein
MTKLSIAHSNIPEKLRDHLIASLTNQERAPSVNRAPAGRTANLDSNEAFVLKHAAPLTAPMF